MSVEHSWRIGGHYDRLVAVGDIHGDLDALVRILLGSGVLSPDGRWSGGSTNVVLLGVLYDRGPESINVIQFVMDLEEEARSNGGALYTLLGNHEMMASQGDYRYVSAVEVLALEHWWFDDVNGLHAVYRGDSPYARWIRTRPTILKAGSTVFVHAGLDAWALTYDPSFINAMVSSWVAYFQGVAEEPDESTLWLTTEDGGGPLWTDRFRVSKDSPPGGDGLSTVLGTVLHHLEARHLVVGHRPTKELDYKIAFPHPVFGEAVAVIDTGISRFYRGRLSALEIVADELLPRYFERGSGELDLTRSIRSECERRRCAIAETNAHGASGTS
jgi:hypothetical protein